VLKNSHSKVRRNFIALGCAIKDDLDFGGHFLSLRWGGFFQTVGFSTTTGESAQVPDPKEFG
jgi:hypothetical protein